MVIIYNNNLWDYIYDLYDDIMDLTNSEYQLLDFQMFYAIEILMQYKPY